jgi:outer membrane protein TolC
MSLEKAPRGNPLSDRKRLGMALILFLGLGLPGSPARVWGQEPIQLPRAAAENGAMTLDDCVSLGLGSQPALAAAQASLAASQSGYQAMQNLRFAALLSKDIPIRRQQACLGIVINSAALQQAEWETRYAITRNFFSVIYAREQEKVLRSAVEKLKKAHADAEKLLKSDDVNIKITKIDVDMLALNVAQYQAKMYEATIGIDRARAALREAIGVGRDYPLKLAEASLPAPVYEINLDQMIDLAWERRGEMVQASTALQVTELEIQAQGKTRKPAAKTFAAAGDVHVTPVPQGIRNSEYQPGAIGLDFPPYLAGHKRDRVRRAQDLSDRAAAVVEKTQNLVALEVEASYLKWKEAIEKIKELDKTPKLVKSIADLVQKRFEDGKATGAEYLQARTLSEQVRAQRNEAYYMHALGLAALERVTAGGYRPPYEAKKD